MAGFLAVVADFFFELRAGTAVVANLFAVGTGSVLGPGCVDFVAPRGDLIQAICSSLRKSNLVLIL